MSFWEKFVAAVKISGQMLPCTAMLSQWLDEIDTGRMKARLDRLEDPLAKYGPKARELMRVLYAIIRAQDHPTTSVEWTSALDPFRKELRYLEAAGFLDGDHAVTGEFAKGLRLSNAGFIIDLALLYDDPAKVIKVNETIENSKSRLNGIDLEIQLACRSL
jgi:hypothetical protein